MLPKKVHFIKLETAEELPTANQDKQIGTVTMNDSPDVSKSTRSSKKKAKNDQPASASDSQASNAGIQDGECQCCRAALADVNAKLDKILQTLNTMGDRLAVLESNLLDTNSRVDSNSKDIDDLKTSVEMVEDKCRSLIKTINNRADGNYKEISKLDDQLDDLQNRNRRNNLVFHGVPEGSEQGKSCEDFVSDFLVSHMKLEGGSEIEIERAHRTPTGHRASSTGTAIQRPRLIHCKLLRYTDRQYILKNAARLLKNNPYKGTNIFISDDVTPRVRQARKRLRDDHLQSIRRDSRVQFAYLPHSVPAVIHYKLTSGPLKTFRLGDADPIS